MQDKWVNVAPQIALEVLGEPKTKTDTEWRWGNKGSFVFNVDAGTFYDFENDEGGGVAWLLETNNIDKDILQKFDHGFAPNGNSIITSTTKDVAIATPKIVGARPFSRDTLLQLWSEAIVKLKYNDSFLVMRFPEGHSIKQKYAPFTKIGDQWYMRRPEGKLPIYSECQHPDKPILVNEGEKACIGASKIYDGDVACWHGGAKSWEKSDWSPIFKRDVLIFPDNDDVGKQAAWSLSKYLKKHGCNVKVALPPKEFADKDDLWDAKEKGYFANSAALVGYINTNKMLPPKGSFYLERADSVMNEISEPDWLIENIAEKASLLGIFGKPKSGKSFVALDMAVAMAKGSDYFGLDANKAPVVMLVGEGKRGVIRRLAALQQSGKDLQGVPLHLSNRGTKILDDEEYDNLIDELDALEELEGSLGCIVIDTLNRNYGAGSENSTEDMTLFISRLDKMIHRYNACVIVVHHTGHNATGRQRGSSVLGASMDYEFRVERPEDIDGQMFVSVKQTLNKDGQGMQDLQFKFEEVHLLGFDNLTSGYLKITDQMPIVKSKTTKTHEEINRALKYVAEQKAREEKINVEDVWLSPSHLCGVAKQIKNTEKDMSDDNIRQYLGQMLDIDQVQCNGNEEYQSIEYKDRISFD